MVGIRLCSCVSIEVFTHAIDKLWFLSGDWLTFAFEELLGINMSCHAHRVRHFHLIGCCPRVGPRCIKGDTRRRKSCQVKVEGNPMTARNPP